MFTEEVHTYLFHFMDPKLTLSPTQTPHRAAGMIGAWTTSKHVIYPENA